MPQNQTRIPWPNWELVRPLGGGSFGRVYEIQRKLLGGGIEKAAMKVISVPSDQTEVQDLLDKGYQPESIHERFLLDMKDIAREYELMAELKGNVNAVYCDDVSYEEKKDGIGWNLYIKMELLAPLEQVLNKTPEEAQVIQLGLDICNVLTTCKKKHIIHRDIKPANIMVSEDGHFKLGDFGIAKTADRTAGGTRTGTYSFMAPEVYNNHPYGTPVDIYSLGMVLYWILNERCGPFLPLPPTVPTAAQIQEANQRRFAGEPLPEPVWGSPQLKKTVLKACAFDANDRFATPMEMAAALAGVQIAERQPETEHTPYESKGPAVTGDQEETLRVKDTDWKWEAAGQESNSRAAGQDSLDVWMEQTMTSQEAENGCMKSVNLPELGMLRVPFPANLKDGDVICVPRKGRLNDATGAQGDVYIRIQVAHQPEPEMLDIWLEQDLFDQEAEAGCTKRVRLPGQDWISIPFPAQVRDGDTIRIPGKGKKNAAAGARGDLYIRVHVKHPPKPGSLDIQLTQVLTAQEAASGCVKRILIPEREWLDVPFPGRVQEGQQIRIPGWGKEDPATGLRGDAYFTIHIQQPTKPVDLDLRLTQNLTYPEAVQGCVKQISIPGRGLARIPFPGNLREGQQIRIPGWGKEDAATGVKGDAYFTIHIAGSIAQPACQTGGGSPQKKKPVWEECKRHPLSMLLGMTVPACGLLYLLSALAPQAYTIYFILAVVPLLLLEWKVMGRFPLIRKLVRWGGYVSAILILYALVSSIP